ncbi:ABC transporter ATP-binding protein [Niabella drilacis]|uniref:ATP-binding cassette, subfamily B n=1 Tax=Niabella drilacis (strain DSM 25811 / CCM 8410 / CCUG 62505 / LMG 26954 / E90) TaxID=1285928 RepID=A0A1G7B7E1_NIADE|nr:ABC transporter ATP-binding protein [Niabella drilacis]SDE22216.1 ATP-binding cassette, subfamily B [Niabella drilacis]
MTEQTTNIGKAAKPSMFRMLRPYRGLISLLLVLALFSNGLSLVVPKLIQSAIDDFSQSRFHMQRLVVYFLAVSVLILLLTYFQSLVQTYASERVARDLRKQLADKISRQTHAFIQDTSPNKLLTNITSDVNAVKTFVSQAIVNIISSVVLILGTAALLLSINWRLGLIVLGVIPIIALAFVFVFKKIKTLFKRSQEVIDKLNKTINESILGAALIRVLNAQFLEYNKFMEASGEAKNLGLSILKLFATLIPIIVFTANLAVLAVVAIGGHYAITGSMTMGEFAAFNSYIAILIFPILLIGFMSNLIARASASYSRIHEVLNAPDTEEGGSFEKQLEGAIEVKDLTVMFGEKKALDHVSFSIKAGSRTAIIGPTAAGKTQLFYALTTLINPQQGTICYDGVPIQTYNQEVLLRQIGLVFQDAIIFNMSLRENIAFNADVSEAALQKAVRTAELSDFVDSLPGGLDTEVSERGLSLSGGQKQRIMLARALAGNPRILLLDEFTARVDRNTEQRIWKNVAENYPGITIVSITQNLDPVKDYEQIILLMEGELIARGTHEQLLRSNPEYNQILQSQQSLNNYQTTEA